MKIDPNATCSGKELGWLLAAPTAPSACSVTRVSSFAPAVDATGWRASPRRRALPRGCRRPWWRGGDARSYYEHAKLAAVQREQIELKIASQRRELLRRDEVMSTWGPVLGFRGRASGWPSKALFVCPDLDLGRQGGAETMTRDDLTDASLGRGFDFSGKPAAGEPTEEGDDA